ncbi:hypothetical protein [Aeromonas dhakensis]|uniref:hypothetical protein n=1 Tax=Aeromonas dhakensis TaxID=196024 RepID=UPI001CF0937E|nr:hypothetical protein [Aeromonas dhakensis]UCM44573.1 hypothetical protein LEO73_18870 [Aeromonas dhakensis]
MEYLYRGVSEDLYEKLNGRLTPKKHNEKFATFVCAGEPHAVCGSGVECGESSLNSVILHQWEQLGLPTAGISTSPHKERAKIYGEEMRKWDTHHFERCVAANRPATCQPSHR